MAGSKRSLAGLIEKNLEIPTIPSVAGQALKALKREDVTADQLARIIETDPGLTARILKVSNSALYARSRKILNIRNATMVLGMRTLGQLVVAASSRALYKKFGAVEKEMWQHSVAVGVATRLLADRVCLEHREESFVSGLLHDVGKVIMNNGAKERFIEARKAMLEGGMSSAEAEEDAFGFNHTDVGALLAQRWELAASIQDAVLWHHDPELADSAAETAPKLCRTVYAANRICHALGLGLPAKEDINLVDDPVFQAFEFDEERLEAFLPEVEKVFREELGAFS